MHACLKIEFTECHNLTSRLISFTNSVYLQDETVVVSLLAIRVAVYESPRNKTNKMTARPVKTQISLGIRPV